MRKNDKLTLTCDGLGSDLEGIAHADGMTVFVPGMLPGETGECVIVKAQPSYSFGKLLSLQNTSPERREPFCPFYPRCGGCAGQHMSYTATLEAKRQQVLECLKRIGGLPLTEEQVRPVLAAEHPQRCRNKTALPVGGTSSDPMIGFYRRRSHDIVPITGCPVSMTELSPAIECLTL